MMSLPVWLPGLMFLPGIVCLHWGGGDLHRGEVCLKGICLQGWSVSMGLPTGGGWRWAAPPKLENQAVHILLECSFVLQDFSRKLHENERNWMEGRCFAPLLDQPMHSVSTISLHACIPPCTALCTPLCVSPCTPSYTLLPPHTSLWRLWKGIELGSILRAAFCTHPLPYHIRQILELSCIEVEMLGSSRKSQK